MKKGIAAFGLGTALAAAAAGSAFAHDATLPKETPHAYNNAVDCSGVTGSDQGTGLSQTTDSAYPTTGIAADCFAANGVDSQDLTATAHILANLSITGIFNDDADTGQVVADAASPDHAADSLTNINSFSFPTQVQGPVESDTMHLEVATNSDWQLSAAITQPFEKTNEAGVFKANDSFAVSGDDQGAGNFAQFDAGLGVPVTLDTLTATDSASTPFTFRSSVPAGLEAGDYAGVITMTVTAV